MNEANLDKTHFKCKICNEWVHMVDATLHRLIHTDRGEYPVDAKPIGAAMAEETKPQDTKHHYVPGASDAVNHPKHYTSHPSGIECIEVVRHFGFNLGNAVKYIWRADLKNNAIEDLEKAMFYISDEIAKRKKAAQK